MMGGSRRRRGSIANKKTKYFKKNGEKERVDCKKTDTKGRKKDAIFSLLFCFFLFFFYFQEQGGWEWVGGPIFLVSPI